jgi:hypothetical protein
MRKRDMHILSAGIFMYTSDLRFQVIHPDKSENWTLQIKSPQERDSGVYECQVSTEPKMSLNYTLNVVGECRLNYSASRLRESRPRVNSLPSSFPGTLRLSIETANLMGEFTRDTSRPRESRAGESLNA